MIPEESLNKTWFIDIDGTIVKHMYNQDIDSAIDSLGEESHTLEIPIEKSVRFLNELSKEDTVVLTTARDGKHKQHTERILMSKKQKRKNYDILPEDYEEDYMVWFW